MLIRGPFIIKWGDVEIENIEEIDFDYSIASKDVQISIDKIAEVDGPQKVSATLTLLKTDIAALSAILPQHYVPYGSRLSTGETVSNLQGVIDMVPQAIDEAYITRNLDIISCNNPSQTARIINARTKIDKVEFSNKLQKIMVKFVGEAEPGQAVVQWFNSANVSPGYLLLAPGSRLLLEGGGRLRL